MNDYIGALVKKFESGSKGSLALGSCGNDWGLSCGSYQLTLRWGNCIGFLRKYFPVRASALYFNSAKADIATQSYPGFAYCSSPDEVKAVWTECCNEAGAEKFFKCEHEHIQNAYYEAVLKKLTGYFNPNNHSRAMQECMWSWSVHRGSVTAYNEFKAACTEAGINPQKTPADTLIDIVYDKRYGIFTNTRYKKGAGASSERETLRSYCNIKPLPYSGMCAGTGGADGVRTDATAVSQPNEKPVMRIGSSGNAVKELQGLLNKKIDAELVVDGVFGDKTHAAVTLYQSENDLVVDGIVGQKTWSKILN